jgi:hypothetical protein
MLSCETGKRICVLIQLVFFKNNLTRIHKSYCLFFLTQDADKLYNSLIAPRSHANIIWAAAWLSFFSGSYAVSREHYHLCFVPFGVWFTSILYCTHPTYGWRRNVDLVWVSSSLIYQSYCAIGADNAVAYFIIMFFAVLSYPIGNHCHKTNSWLGIICHSFIHILGNVANFTLYSGSVVPQCHFKRSYNLNSVTLNGRTTLNSRVT